MKKIIFNSILSAAIISGSALLSCNGGNSNSNTGDTQATMLTGNTDNINIQETAEANSNGTLSTMSAPESTSTPTVEAGMDGDVYRYGNHTYQVKGDFKTDIITTSDFNEVTFSNIPSDYTEFEKVYKEYLGKHINGTAAMMVMAMEMYGRDKSVGERCIRLINTPNNVSSVMNILKDRYGNYTSDGYSQRYIAAALLDGAVRTNSYTPNEPYTVKCQGSPNGTKQMTMPKYGTVYYMYVIGGGWDTHQRQCEIVMFEDDEATGLYHMNNCPSFYTQCQQIKGEWKGLK
ncbi:MAG: hypothetical protein IKR94_08920 [Bacteroidales bacterium]|nr:hypothetical protein [Bacteroidales bacterium]